MWMTESNNENNGKEKFVFEKSDIIPALIGGITLIMNIVSYFFLPETLVTGFRMFNETPHCGRLMYVIMASFLVVTPSLMCILTEKKKKWLAFAAVLGTANVVCLALNLF